MKKSTFERMVEKAFWGLEARHGFRKTETKFENRSVTVRFQNATTEILLNYEIGNTPWLEIADVHHVGNKSTLGWLLVVGSCGLVGGWIMLGRLAVLVGDSQD